jgi:hypothetical protein
MDPQCMFGGHDMSHGEGLIWICLGTLSLVGVSLSFAFVKIDCE